MLNKKKIRTMSKIAVMEKHHGEELQKAREYYRSDYVAVQLLKNACYLTVAYMIGLLLWGVANMDMPYADQGDTDRSDRQLSAVYDRRSAAYLCDNYETVFLRAGAVPALSGAAAETGR